MEATRVRNSGGTRRRYSAQLKNFKCGYLSLWNHEAEDYLRLNELLHTSLGMAGQCLLSYNLIDSSLIKSFSSMIILR